MIMPAKLISVQTLFFLIVREAATIENPVI